MKHKALSLRGISRIVGIAAASTLALSGCSVTGVSGDAGEAGDGTGTVNALFMKQAGLSESDIASIMQALKLYRLDNQRYPTGEQGLPALISKPEQPPLPPNWKSGGYLERLPKDPWGRPYVYVNPGVKGEIEVFSFGADGQLGGTGIDADVGSWDL